MLQNKKIRYLIRKTSRIVKKLSVDLPVTAVVVITAAALFVYNVMADTQIEKYAKAKGVIIIDKDYHDGIFIKTDFNSELAGLLSDRQRVSWYTNYGSNRYTGRLSFNRTTQKYMVRINRLDVIKEFGMASGSFFETNSIKVNIEMPYKKESVLKNVLRRMDKKD